MKRILMIGAIYILLSCVNSVYAEIKIKEPVYDIASGSSISYIRDAGNNTRGYSLNIDTSLSHGYSAASINGKYIRFNDGKKLYGFQTEFTIWLLANLGGGAGYLWGDKKGPVYHTFVGIPLWTSLKHEFVEPYYRCNFFKGEKYHEIGLMVKITTYTM